MKSKKHSSPGSVSCHRKQYTLGRVLHVDTIREPPEFGGWLVSQVGLQPNSDGRSADLVIHFVDELTAGPFRRLDLNGTTFGFDSEHFYLVDRKGGRARFNFDALGRGEELLCERRWQFSESILRDLLAVMALGKGWVLLHGSAFEYEGLGILVAGWQTSGKSEFLLGMRGQARFISDEPTLVHAATGRIVASSALVPLWDWQIQQLGCERDLTSSNRMRVRSARLLRRLLPPGNGDGMLAKGVATVHRKLKAFTRVPVGPERVFEVVRDDDQVMVDVVLTGSIGSLDVQQIPGETFAKKMARSQMYERRGLAERYQQFLYAFPDRASEVLDGADGREAALLAELMADRTVFDLVHPYPGRLSDHGALATEAIRRAAERPRSLARA
jgi:hypothetical protein